MTQFIQSEGEQPSTVVACPFHKYLAPGDSSFVVSVPKPFLTYFSPINGGSLLKRKFFFASLRLVPDFFSRDAQMYDLDSDVDLETRVNLQFYLMHKISPLLFTSAGNSVGGWEFETKVNVLSDNKIETFFESVNKYSESNKPQSLVGAPFFFDWTEESFQQSVMDQSLAAAVVPASSDVTINEFVPAMSLLFYGVPKVDPTKHFNVLQPSQRKIPEANNYIFPSEAYESEELLSTLRVRLAVAPNTKILFSQKKMLNLLGFQPDRRTGYKFEFVNPSNDNYMYFVAEDPPTLNQYNYGKINATVAANVLISTVQNLPMTLKQKRSNAYLYKELKKSVNKLAQETNIDFNIEYNTTSEIFKFVFPVNTGIKTVLHCDTDFSSRLGYGVKREIANTDTSVSVKNTIDKSAAKAKVLSFDTGHVIVTCFNTSSNQTSISNNQYMASLLPDNAGMMTISPCLGNDIPTFVPPNFEQDGQNNVPLLCNLLKFNDLGDPVPFQWKTGGYISGILQGKL